MSSNGKQESEYAIDKLFGGLDNQTAETVQQLYDNGSSQQRFIITLWRKLKRENNEKESK